MNFSVIVAAAQNNGIGKAGSMPWRLKGDMAFFKRVTSFVPATLPKSKNAVIMGRKTWDSIPEKFKPLPGRLNVVLTRNGEVLKAKTQEFDNVKVYGTLSEALKELNKITEIFRVFLIGGGEIYKEGLQSDLCNRIILTKVLTDFDCDTFFPQIPDRFATLPIEKLEEFSGSNVSHDIIEENGIPYRFSLLEASGN